MSQDNFLVEALQKAENANQFARACQVCEAMAQMGSSAREHVQKVLRAGTIGERKLSEILTDSGYPTGRRAIAKHRSEGHS